MRGSRAALVIGHPGHEVGVHRWLTLARPRVFVLTDGSGHSSRPRLNLTTEALAQAGASPCGIYGRFPDAAVYGAILDHDFDFFTNLAEEIARALVREGVEYVVSDALEGYNPTHDACRLVAAAAAAIASRAAGRRVACYEFPLVGRPAACPDELRSRAVWLRLDDAMFARKIAAARANPYISAELDFLLSRMSLDEFRVECLRPVGGRHRPFEEPPFYERHGERRVAEGYYGRVLRHREHFLPLAEALRHYVGGEA